jgi:NADPH:quinone reductase-like Zn-dependent oxidoreductase
MGSNPYPAGGLGLDSSGVVSRVGPEVKGLSVGDRVMCLGTGNLASHLITPEAFCEKIPDNLSFEEAATLPAAYSTAIAALHNVGGLHSGQVNQDASPPSSPVCLTLHHSLFSSTAPAEASAWQRSSSPR